MKLLLYILAAILLAPFVLGVVCGAALMLNLPFISRFFERKAAKDAAMLSGNWPPIPGPLPKPPAPPLDSSFYRGRRES